MKTKISALTFEEDIYQKYSHIGKPPFFVRLFVKSKNPKEQELNFEEQTMINTGYVFFIQSTANIYYISKNQIIIRGEIQNMINSHNENDQESFEFFKKSFFELAKTYYPEQSIEFNHKDKISRGEFL